MDETVAERPVRPIAIAHHGLYSMLLPVPVVCFIGVLLTDITYLQSGGNMIWLDFSSWLLLFGLIFGAIAAIILLIDFFRGSHGGRADMLFFYLGWLIELLSMFVHQRDGWTAVAGLGIILSVIGAALFLIAAWLHRPAVEVVR